jgi:hypothetical protein
MQTTASTYLTPQQVAKELNVSTDTVLRRFAQEPSVIDLGTPETLHTRRHRVLRIPHAVVDRVIREARVA